MDAYTGQINLICILLIIVGAILSVIGTLYYKRWVEKRKEREEKEFAEYGPMGKPVAMYRNGKRIPVKPHPKKPIEYKFSELASHLTGISIPIFGISWQPPESERKIIRSIIVFLEDRRVLYSSFALEREDLVTKSIIAIREKITDSLQRLPSSSKATESLRAMRLACREYLNDAATSPSEHSMITMELAPSLGKFRTIFGYHVAHLAIMYGIDIEGDLAKILPAELRKDIDVIE